MTEEWKVVDNNQYYSVSSLGNVKRNKDGKILKKYPQKNGYVYVWLNRGSGNYSVPIHRLVAEAFLKEDMTNDKYFVDHINTIRNDNRVCNLRWVTPKENSNNETTKLNRRKRYVQEFLE